MSRLPAAGTALQGTAPTRQAMQRALESPLTRVW
jgi:hypothetical protein